MQVFLTLETLIVNLILLVFLCVSLIAEYNSVTGTANVNMQMTVFYPSHSVRFQKYLGPLGSNVKMGNAYFISGLFKFSRSGKIMVEATDIKYLKIPHLNCNTSEGPSMLVSNA